MPARYLSIRREVFVYSLKNGMLSKEFVNRVLQIVSQKHLTFYINVRLKFII